jgi:hypothetical protein
MFLLPSASPPVSAGLILIQELGVVVLDVIVVGIRAPIVTHIYYYNKFIINNMKLLLAFLPLLFSIS